MSRPEETTKSKIINVVIPTIISIIVFLISLYLDILSKDTQMFWVQRSGAIITILGAWIAFHESRESMKVVGTHVYMDTTSPYKYLSLIIIAVGTVTWGYGDIPFK